MSDSYATWIQIGGKCPREELDELLQLIEEWNLHTDEDDEPFEAGAFEPDGQPLSLHHYEKSWGVFDEIEDVCTRLGLSWARWASDGCKVIHIPGLGAFDASCDPEEGDTVLSLREVRRRGFDTLGQVTQYLEWCDAEMPAFEVVG